MGFQDKYTAVSELRAVFRVAVSGGDRREALGRFWEKDIGIRVQRLLEDSGLFELVMVDVSAPSRLEKRR